MGESGSSDDGLPSDPGFLAVLDQVAAAPALALAGGELAPGAQFGGLTITRRIGAGGMGVVYLARDARLERDVAVKVLREERSSAQGRARLLREAQAIAKMTHPNVITIHAVGTSGDDAYLEMEYVDGETLGAYLGAQPRPRRAVLERFIAAGRGLAAAHGAGLVHRDFKPDNVLCGRDGRIRVTDFGLASRPGGVGALASTLRGGTPGYMAPEQARGAAVDARADQFSFSVALYEALYGTRPFADEAARDAGRVSPAEAGAAVPSRLRALLLRGLAADPDRRHPSMTGYLDALADDPARRWRRRAAAAAALAAVALAATALARRGTAADPCPSPAARLAGVWDPAVAARVRATFAASGRAHAAATFDRVSALLDRRAAAWLAMHGDACRATRVRGERSAAVLDLRMRCLDRRLSELRASTEVLAARPDPIVVDRAVDALLELAPLAACGEVDELAGGAAPLGPAARARADALAAQVDVSQALQKTGQPGPARAALDAIWPDLMAAGDPALAARAVLLRGGLLEDGGALADAEATYKRAIRAAAEAGDDEREAEGWIALLWLATKRRDFAAARSLGEAAELRVVRAGGATRLRGRLLSAEGAAAYREGDGERAGARFGEALALREREEPPDRLEIAALLDNLGAVSDAQGRPAEAELLEARALAIKEEVLGPDHPHLAVNLLNLGLTRRQLRKRAAARRDLERALRLREMLGPDHPDVADVHLALGQLDRDEGRLAEAQHHGERALAALTAAFGPSSPRTITPRRQLADVLAAEGEVGAAERLLEEAIAISEESGSPMLPGALSDLGSLLMEQAPARAEPLLLRSLALFREHGSDPADIATVEERLGSLYQATGRCRQAEPLLVHALAGFAAAVPPLPPAAALLALGRCHLTAGDAERALAELIAAALAAGVDPAERATAGESWFACAGALWARGRPGDRARARGLAERARAALAGDGRPAVRARAGEVAAWLRAHP